MSKDVSGGDSAAPDQAGRRSGLSLDQRLALTAATSRLQRDFPGVFTTATIEQVLYTSHDQVTADSAITRFLRAKRFARQQLQALARLQGHHTDTTPVVLFVSAHDDNCSPMALGFFQHLAQDRALAWSAGSQPSNDINPTTVAAMHERGIDLTNEFPTPWTDELVRAADVVITMGGGSTLPIVADKRYLDWDINDPAGLSLETVRPIRDEIERKVHSLLDHLGISLPPDQPAAGPPPL